MNITDIKIRKHINEGRMRAVMSVTFDDAIVVHDIKVIAGPERYFLAMPSQKLFDGTFRDIMHPINTQEREALEQAVLQYYFDELKVMEASEAVFDDTLV